MRFLLGHHLTVTRQEQDGEEMSGRYGEHQQKDCLHARSQLRRGAFVALAMPLISQPTTDWTMTLVGVEIKPMPKPHTAIIPAQ
jgi:hypothetical protein